MAGFSDYLENKVLDHILMNTAYAIPTGLFIGLFTSLADDGTGTEVVGDGYARVASTGTDWAVAAAGSIANSAIITFPTVGAGGWTTVNFFGIYDEAAVNLLAWGTVAPSYTGVETDNPTFLAGDLVITLD
jgi:hypothetical protein